MQTLELPDSRPAKNCRSSSVDSKRAPAQMHFSSLPQGSKGLLAELAGTQSALLMASKTLNSHGVSLRATPSKATAGKRASKAMKKLFSKHRDPEAIAILKAKPPHIKQARNALSRAFRKQGGDPCTDDMAFEAMFDQADADNSGQVSAEELANVMYDGDVDGAKEFIAAIDADQNGSLSLDEAMRGVRNAYCGLEEGQQQGEQERGGDPCTDDAAFEEIFNHVDADGSGSVSADAPRKLDTFFILLHFFLASKFSRTPWLPLPVSFHAACTISLFRMPLFT